MSMYSQEQRWDHQRDLAKHEPSPRHQKRAVVKLIGYCNGLIRAGDLGPLVAQGLHDRLREVCCEFELDQPPAPKVPA